MANFTQNINDHSYDDNLIVNPDLGFMQQMGSKLDTEYDAGANAIQQSYSQILNAPVTGQEAEDRRSSYLKQINSGLQELGKSDLSDSRNIQKAQALYSPFWKDQDMLTNMNDTKFINDNIQKIQSGLFSKDKQERDLYDPIQLQDQQGMLAELKEAGLDRDKLSAIQRRQVTPFKNFRDSLNSAMLQEGKDKGGLVSMEFDQVKGPYIVTTINGQRSKQGFASWAASNLSGTDFSSQFQMIGRVKVDRMKSMLREQNPLITASQMSEAIADYTVSRTKEVIAANIADNKLDLFNTQKQIDIILARGNGKVMPSDKGLYDSLADQFQSQSDTSESLKVSENNYLNGGSDKDLRDIKDNPQDYFAQIEKSNTIKNYAIGRSSIEGIKYKENTAYIANQTNITNNRRVNEEIRENKAKDAIASGTLDLARQTEAFDEANGKKNADGTRSNGTNDSIDVRTGTVAKDIVDFGTIKNPADKYNETLADNSAVAHGMKWDSDGAAKMLIGRVVKIGSGANVTTATIEATDIDLASSALAKIKTDKTYKPSDSEKSALEKVGSSIGVNNFLDPALMETKLTDALGVEVLDQNGVPTQASRSASRQVIAADDLLAKNMALEAQRNESVKAFVNSKGIDQSIVSPDGVGGKRLVSRDDLLKSTSSLLGNIPLNDGSVISSKDISDAYYNGTFNWLGNGGFSIGERKVAGIDIDESAYLKNIGSNQSYAYMGPSGVGAMMDLLLHDYQSKMGSRYGLSGDFNKKISDAQNKVVSGISNYGASIMDKGHSVSYNLLNKSQKATLNKTAIDLSDPSNRSPLIDGVEAKDLPSVDAILKQGGDGYIQSTQYKPFGGPGGTPAMQVFFNDTKSKENMDATTKKILDMKSIMVPIKPDASSLQLQQLMHSAGNTAYSDMYTGTRYGSNPIQEAHNYTYKLEPISPDKDGRRTKVHVTVSAKLIDPVTGQLAEDRELMSRYGGVGGIDIELADKTPYQIKQELDAFGDNNLSTNISRYASYVKTHTDAKFNQLEHPNK